MMVQLRLYFHIGIFCATDISNIIMLWFITLFYMIKSLCLCFDNFFSVPWQVLYFLQSLNYTAYHFNLAFKL